jgi:hypothetical protein
MSEPQHHDPSDSPERIATDRDVVGLLGLIAYTELATFGRLAADAANAPTLAQRHQLSRHAGKMLARHERVLARIADLGGDPEAEMGGFDGIFDDFEARTPSSTWWEGVLKGYVGHGVADDFCRLAADGLDDESRALVLEILSDGVDSERSATVIADAAAADPVLASRLALWGRRLVGLSRLLADGASHRAEAGQAGAADATGTAADRQAWVFSQLTAEHTRRMGRLGLAA